MRPRRRCQRTAPATTRLRNAGSTARTTPLRQAASLPTTLKDAPPPTQSLAKRPGGPARHPAQTRDARLLANYYLRMNRCRKHCSEKLTSNIDDGLPATKKAA